MLLRDLIVEETNPQEPQDNVFDIPEWSLDEFHTRLEKLNKRASKLGVAPVRVIEMGSKQVKDPRYKDTAGLSDVEVPKIQIHTFRLEGEPPKLAGWTFLGTLDHVSIPGQVVVNTVPGQTIPQQFFNVEPVCDHCNKIRNRNETFVLRHDNGDYMKVGRMCLRDFLGHDPTRAVQALQALFKFAKSLADENNWGGGGGWSSWSYDPVRVLALTAAVIEKDGWTPRSAGGGDRTPTVYTVSELLQPGRDAEAVARYRRLHDHYNTSDPKWKEEADAAIAWLDTQENNNSEYMHNLKIIRQASDVPAKMLGYWVSLVAAHKRAQEQLVLSQSDKKVNEWYGNVGDKIETNVKVVSIRHTEGYYGTVHIHRFLTDDGHTLIWFANTSNAGMEPERKYRIKGTVKKHDKYQEWKQTILSRVKKVKDLDDENSSAD
jgi:hypothetical protein